MIPVGSSGPTAALPFSLYNATTGAAITAKSWNNVGGGLTDELKIRVPGGAYANATISRIVEIGFGDYEYQLSATETATAGTIYYYPNVSGADQRARWERILSLSLADIADAVWDEVMENSKTARQWMRGFKSVLWGKVTDFTTGTRNFRDDADTKNRVTATVGSTGRTAVSEDLT